MKIPFREHHLLTLLRGYQNQNYPLDLYISFYFRDHKSLGSKDRGWIAETVYSIVRWQGLLDFISKESTIESRWKAYQTFSPKDWLDDETIPLHIRCSFPEALFNHLADSYGPQKGAEIGLASNLPAPTTIRANELKISRDALLEKWRNFYDVIPCAVSRTGIIFRKKINFFTLPEFKEGLFEVQDEGSQLIAEMVGANPGDWVMDYCAGSGGKTLAFAPKMKNTGQIFLHDSRPFALGEARKRLRRAGVQNAQIVLPNDLKLKKLKKRMDWILVDAPCSGTGTMRRNPDMKWKFTEDSFKRLLGLQRTIFEKALSFLKPDGHIVYATCSLLKEENQEQIEHFMKTYSLEKVGDDFQSLPSEGSMDGFFSVVLKFKK